MTFRQCQLGDVANGGLAGLIIVAASSQGQCSVSKDESLCYDINKLSTAYPLTVGAWPKDENSKSC